MSVGERDIRGNSLGELGTLIHNAGGIYGPVSYTHLTLPTIYSV